MHALMRSAALSAALFALLATPARAVPQATVDAVVTPAWIERNGRTRPLDVGMEVKNGDRIRTGDGARAYLKLAEGSTVKIGEKASLGFFSRSLKPNKSFRGALDVATGAFRFTTDALRKVKERDVAVRVGTATVGIRGTDVWGKSDGDRDLVMLIEGRIEVRHASGETVEMGEPLTVFVAPKGAAPLPLTAASQEELHARARETEIVAGDGAARRGGRWRLSLGSFADEAAALERYDLAREAGFAVVIVPRAAEDGAWIYNVVQKGFADEAEAQRTAARLKAATGFAAAPAR